MRRRVFLRRKPPVFLPEVNLVVKAVRIVRSVRQMPCRTYRALSLARHENFNFSCDPCVLAVQSLPHLRMSLWCVSSLEQWVGVEPTGEHVNMDDPLY